MKAIGKKKSNITKISSPYKLLSPQSPRWWAKSWIYSAPLLKGCREAQAEPDYTQSKHHQTLNFLLLHPGCVSLPSHQQPVISQRKQVPKIATVCSIFLVSWLSAWQNKTLLLFAKPFWQGWEHATSMSAENQTEAAELRTERKKPGVLAPGFPSETALLLANAWLLWDWDFPWDGHYELWITYFQTYLAQG